MERVDQLSYSNGETNMFEALTTTARRIYNGPGIRGDVRTMKQ